MVMVSISSNEENKWERLALTEGQGLGDVRIWFIWMGTCNLNRSTGISVINVQVCHQNSHILVSPH